MLLSLFVFSNCIFQNQLCSSAASIKVQYALALTSCQHDIQSWLSLARESFGLVTAEHTAAILLYEFVGWTCTKLWGLYASLCYNESWIPTTNVLDYCFVSKCLIGRASINADAATSQQGTLAPVCGSFSNRRLSLHQRYLKQTTSRHDAAATEAPRLQGGRLLLNLGFLLEQTLEVGHKAGITLNKVFTPKPTSDGVCVCVCVFI